MGKLHLTVFLVCRVCDEIIEKTKRECVTDRNDSGQAGLHLAAIEGHLEVIKLLLKKGADINAG